MQVKRSCLIHGDRCVNALHRRLLGVAWLLLGLAGLPQQGLAAEAANAYDPPPNLLEPPQLVAALRAGGYVVYFRHGITDHTLDDADRENLTRCATQRPLSEAGRQQMRGIGEAIKALNIRISTVLSSPFCRAMDTATLAFGRLEVVDDLRQDVDADEATAERRAQALRKMLATVPSEPGTNTVLTGHTGNLLEAVGLWPKPEGVAIVFKPGADGKFTYIATILPTQWAELVRRARKIR